MERNLENLLNKRLEGRLSNIFKVMKLMIQDLNPYCLVLVLYHKASDGRIFII